MNSPIETVQVTFYKCPHCAKLAPTDEGARTCCFCEKCDRIGKRRSSYSFLCDRCFRKNEIANARARVSRLEERIKKFESEIDATKAELMTACAELEIARALPVNDKPTAGGVEA